MQNLTTDEELAASAKSGDSEAFAELTRRHYDGSLKLALYMLRQREEAEDEVQNAYGRAFQNIASFREEAKFSTWITRIVMNSCLMRIRRRQRVQMQSIEDTLPGSDGFVNRESSQEEDMGRREVIQRLQAEMKRIPPLLRRVLELRDINELPMEAVAYSLGISIPAAKSRLLRARHELRLRMEKHCVRNGAAALMA